MSASDASNAHRLHHLLWEANVALVPLMETAFTDTELTLPLAGLLDEIATTPGATVAEISRRSLKTQQAISQAVVKLERHGYVQRRVGSGRGVGLFLTPAGELASADGVAREEQMEVRLREVLGTELYERLTDALEQARPMLFDDAEADHPTKVSSP